MYFVFRATDCSAQLSLWVLRLLLQLASAHARAACDDIADLSSPLNTEALTSNFKVPAPSNTHNTHL
jgi:hypothetical protein